MKVNDANPDDLELIPWSVKENERFRDERKLKKYNTIACILHLIQAIALLILGKTNMKTIANCFNFKQFFKY